MIKRTLLILVSVLCIYGVSFAQNPTPTTNDWVVSRMQQQFWKFAVVDDGIYRIDYTTMQQSGILNAPGFDPRRIQIFRNGAEIPIYVEGEGDGIFNSTDYVEFYGKGNDAEMDTLLYLGSDDGVNREFSLFTDTAYYFISLGASANNLRMTNETDNSFSTYSPAQNYYIARRYEEPADLYAFGTLYGESRIYDSEYLNGEGWVAGPFGFIQGQIKTRTYTFQTDGVYTSGPAPLLNFEVVGGSNFSGFSGYKHHVKVLLNGGATPIDNFYYNGYFSQERSLNLTNSQINNSTTQFTFSIIDDLSSGVPSANRVDRNSLAWIELFYPHTNDLNNRSEDYMIIPDHGSLTKSYYSFTNFNQISGDIFIYDLTNAKRIKVYPGSGVYDVLVPNSLSGNPGDKECYMTSVGNFKSITDIKTLNPNNKFIDYDDIFSQNSYDFIFITDEKLQTSVQDYKMHRDQFGYPTTYNSHIVYIEDLYEQFSYGIRKSPMAIENFLKFLYINGYKPEFIYLVGKGYSPHQFRDDPTLFDGNMIPGWGYPASDNLYLNKLDSIYVSDMFIGRLAAKSNAEVDAYLDKVKQHEDSLQHSLLWKKRVIHFGGGKNTSEQNDIQAQLKIFENYISSPYYGGNVTQILKKTTSPIEINTSQALKDLINSGIGIMTFYGHGSSGGFDVSTDEINTYQNYGKYPFVIANSCYSGNLFLSNISKSEEFVLTPEKGGIAYFGAGTSATIPNLGITSDSLYRMISRDAYSEPLGKSTRLSLRYFANTLDYYKVLSLQQSLFHGDPSLVLMADTMPDYQIDASKVYFTPDNVTNEIDSFVVNIVSTNYGMAVDDKFDVHLKRTYPDGSYVDTVFERVSTAFRDTFRIKLPVSKLSGLGLNDIEVYLDHGFDIDEHNESNNSVKTTLFIKSANLLPIMPPEYGIVGHQGVTLYSSSSDPFASQFKYVVEIDSSMKFANPLDTYTGTHSGGVVSWTPVVYLQDSQTYYWRISLDSSLTLDGKFDWRYSSFSYIPSKSGWGQLDFDQYAKDEYQYITQDTNTNLFEFAQDLVTLKAQTGIYPQTDPDDHYYSINATFQKKASHLISQQIAGGFIFAVFDTTSATPWASDNINGTWTGPLGNVQAPYTFEAAFEFNTHDSLGRESIIDFIDSIPSGYYVLAYSIKNHNAPNFPENLYQAFEDIGSASIRILPTNSSYILFGRKDAQVGDPIFVKEKVGVTTDTIQQQYAITTNWDEGKVASTLVGPAENWHSLHFYHNDHPGDPADTDFLRLEVKGVYQNGAEDPNSIIDTVLAGNLDILNLGSMLDTSSYAFLRLIAHQYDNTHHTPRQLDKWMVIYDPVPETALDPSVSFGFYNDTVLQGDSIYFNVACRNISEADFTDSLLVKCWIIDSERKTWFQTFKRYEPHPAGDTLIIDSLGFLTTDLADGLSSLWIEVNPINPASNDYDQLEVTHINNLGELFFYVKKDDENPILDVTFDGVHILNGDIVSAMPTIEISLDDENPFLLMDSPDDTSRFKVWLQYENGPFELVPFTNSDGSENMIFYPADGPENRCRIVWAGDFTDKDGEYTLRVEATDKSENQAGRITYQISFEIISESSITNVMNWPNPFNSMTYFVFELTGSEVPTDLRIQIMTVSGKMIRELDLNDLGPIHVGRNITDGGWDGTDEYGDKLANGVYLYRVISNIDGETIRHRVVDEIDGYFLEGWGKMYLMR